MHEKYRSKGAAIEIFWSWIFIKNTLKCWCDTCRRPVISPRWSDSDVEEGILQVSLTPVWLWVCPCTHVWPRLWKRLLVHLLVSKWNSLCAETWAPRCPNWSIQVEDIGQTAPSTWPHLQRRALTPLQKERNEDDEWVLGPLLTHLPLTLCAMCPYTL